MLETETRSAALWSQAQRLMPGGVNSPVRAFRAVGGDPIFVARAAGAFVWDEDDRRYIDYVGAWGPMILGHAHPQVVETVQEAASRGLAYGAPTLAENQLATMIREAMPALELVRLVNSGTEAVMSAVRLARAFTGRAKVIKFAGCYHGHSDALLVKAGSGVATLSLPDSPGIPTAVAADTISLPFNDLQAVLSAFTTYPDEIAAVILEPVIGNAGVIPPVPDYLPQLREICDRHGALLIFDEVMTGFRIARGGAQALFAVKPDLTCLAKIIGGGVPCGAYGGRADIMALVAPSGPVYQAGTMSGNPLATAAGIATLRALAEPGVYARLDRVAKRLADGLMAIAAAVGVPLHVQRVGSMLTAFFTDQTVIDWQTAKKCDTAAFAIFHRGMRERGIYLPPSQFEAWFVSLAHFEPEVDATLEAANGALGELARQY
ncbi:MAG: glutamate-1-semialdehyde 2,1-aminomutase [Cyanobacteria bacterium NC_groundwater_1444_Ag_S-0.65um_54_12]|nr:glutamate-1-semialdehyde 2,1-aminomutase [Cyanobacteria bacterium NC_groundwater_1444_Ag_S-0.65um_54_12]